MPRRPCVRFSHARRSSPTPRATFGMVNRVTWKIPNALALVGSRSGEERNAMTASWITQLSMEPVLAASSLRTSVCVMTITVNRGC
ncbi:flavin reductase [Candidatus Poriferisodalis sp.]|uniref:flavin reductase n=1 Tax=Candidatus Poriferisodalis sp. TaxID=3101277 RepID=UPI003B01C462